MAFPSLSRRPSKIQKSARDNAIKKEFGQGYEHRRPRFTRPVYDFLVSYDLLPTADVDLLIAHYEEVGMYASFDWADREGNVFEVYYDEPIEYDFAVEGWYQVKAIKLKGV